MAATSTPLPTSDFRKRRSILSDDDVSLAGSPLKRPVTLSSVEEAENEDEERSRRRSMASIAEKLNETEHYSKDTILSHLETCMKLYADNKIHTKNIWGFKIIDYMSAMVRDNTFDRDTLKYATSTMEIGAKVFGLRVDCVHNQTLQLASNMLRNFNAENDEGEGVDENAPEDDANTTKQAAKPRRAKKHKILSGAEPSIVKDYKSLLVPIKQLPSIDFQVGQARTHTGGNNFLTTCIPMNCDTRFMFMSNEKYFQTMDDLENYVVEPIEFPVEVPEFDKLSLCDPFQDFNFADWHPENEKVDSQSLRDEPIFDTAGQPIPELDGSIHDPFMDPLGNDSYDGEEIIAPQMGQPNIEFVTDAFIPNESNNEYLYNYTAPDSSQIVINLWAGPSHWKLKNIKRRTATFTGSVQQKDEQKKKKRTKRQDASEGMFNEDEELTTTTQHPHRVKKVKKSKFRVPPQYITELMKPMESFRTRYIIPSAAVANAGKQQEHVDNIPGYEYNYNNPNDSQFCVNANDENNDYDDEPLNNDDEFMGAGEMLNDDGPMHMMNDNDIDMPEIVPKSTIGYAKTAKKMNMKKLKLAIWHSLVGCDTYTHGENNDDKGMKIVGEKHFKELYTTLPKKLNRTMQEALSVPLAFAALLHLGNEKILILKGNDQMDDIGIRQE